MNGAESAEASIPGVRIWGPVPKAQAIGAGALAAASSVLLAPLRAPAQLFDRLASLVPDEVLPRASDTVHTLRLHCAKRPRGGFHRETGPKTTLFPMEMGSSPRLHLREVGRADITARGAGGAASFRPYPGMLPAPPPPTPQPRPPAAHSFPRPQSVHRPDLRLNLSLELRAQMRSPLTTHQPLPMLSVTVQIILVLTQSCRQVTGPIFTAPRTRSRSRNRST